jgi:uncharacterized protein YoxC
MALAAITLALLILVAALSVLSVRIAIEKKELQSIRKKIDGAEASIKEISGSLLAIKKQGNSA